MWTSMESPVGQIVIIGNSHAITGLYFADPGAEPSLDERDDAHPLMVEAVRQLRGYFDGTLTDFDLPLEPTGTRFQQRVWEQLLLVGHGETVSYGAIAARLGLPAGASRAVGMANGRNPIAIVVPCHRVIGGSGKLIGYAGGLERKKTLLNLERPGLF